jgi:hypothetical protein
MSRACCERGYLQHPTSGVFLLSSPCCDYIACCVQHPTSGASSPFSSTQHLTSHVCNIETQHLQHWKIMFATPNNTCLQHRDSASAASEINGCDIQHQRPSPQTHKMSATSKINVCIPLRHVTVNPRPSDRALIVHIHPEGSIVL